MQTEPSNLITIMHHLRTVVSQMRPLGDMTFGEFCVLNKIESIKNQGQQLTPTSLNDLLGTKKPATSRLLTVLEKKGLIQKINDKKDHRICYIQLTEIGSKQLLEQKKEYHYLMNQVCVKMGTDEIVQMQESLQKLTHILEEEILV